jgi:hypothetical protein
MHHAAAFSKCCRAAIPNSDVPMPSAVIIGSVPRPNASIVAMPCAIVPPLTASAKNA